MELFFQEAWLQEVRQMGQVIFVVLSKLYYLFCLMINVFIGKYIWQAKSIPPWSIFFLMYGYQKNTKSFGNVRVSTDTKKGKQAPKK